jgi:hypothetical protein
MPADMRGLLAAHISGEKILSRQTPPPMLVDKPPLSGRA